MKWTLDEGKEYLQEGEDGHDLPSAAPTNKGVWTLIKLSPPLVNVLPTSYYTVVCCGGKKYFEEFEWKKCTLAQILGTHRLPVPNLLVYSCLPVRNLLVYSWLPVPNLLVYHRLPVPNLLVNYWLPVPNLLVYYWLPVPNLLVYYRLPLPNLLVYYWLPVFCTQPTSPLLTTCVLHPFY